PAHHLLTLEAQPLGFGSSGEGGELLNVGAGDEVVRLTRNEHHCSDGGVIAEANQQGLELHLDRRAELVHRLAREIEGDDRDRAFESGSKCRHGQRLLVFGLWSLVFGPEHRTADLRTNDQRPTTNDHIHEPRSNTIAYPIPPCAQMDSKPNSTPRRRISLVKVVTSRAPVAPKGCPIAMEPPITLVRVQSTSPTGPESPSRSAQAREPHAWTLERTCEAKASWISTTPNCRQVIPARSSALGTAYTGPMSSCQPGST